MAENAAGEKLPLLIIFKSENVWDTWKEPAGEEYPDMTCAVTNNVWVEAETFSNKFMKRFIRKVRPENPAVLICDCHSFTLLWDEFKTQKKKRKFYNFEIATTHRPCSSADDHIVFEPFKIIRVEEIVKGRIVTYASKLQ
jgi:hypothetical protein